MKKVPPVPPRPPQNIQIPHHVSDVSAVGSCRFSIEPEIWNSFKFKVVLFVEDEIILKKTINVRKPDLKSAYDWMIKKYPKPYSFELKSY